MSTETMVKLSLLEIYTAYSTLGFLLQNGTYPDTLSGYRLAKVRRTLKDIALDFEERRNALVERFGTRDDNGQMAIRPSDENWKAFSAENKALGAITEHILVMYLTLKDLGDTVPPGAIEALLPFIQDPE